jgi:hypothetical protein
MRYGKVLSRKHNLVAKIDGLGVAGGGRASSLKFHKSQPCNLRRPRQDGVINW